MRELTINEVEFIAAAGEFSYAELAGAVTAGALGGAMAGAMVGGVGTGPGAIAGAAIGGATYTAGKMVESIFSNGNSGQQTSANYPLYGN